MYSRPQRSRTGVSSGAIGQLFDVYSNGSRKGQSTVSRGIRASPKDKKNVSLLRNHVLASIITRVNSIHLPNIWCYQWKPFGDDKPKQGRVVVYRASTPQDWGSINGLERSTLPFIPSTLGR
ncbi:hypothetical protein TNCV_1901111 [Trichonephila clavipes]|nr:hypothetical protein TNCV_1901111 [Trichonephila clavipes]